MADLKCYAGKCAHGLTVICLSTLASILAPLIFMLVMIIGFLQVEIVSVRLLMSCIRKEPE